jgi:transposase-like protein
MSTRTHSRTELDVLGGRAGGERSEPGGRARRDAGGAGPEGSVPAERLAAAGGRSGGLPAELTRRLVERALEVELTEHLGYEPHAAPPGGADNARNGSTPKTFQTEHGPVRIEAPRDRMGTFEPRPVRKRQRRFEGFDGKIVAMYARGLTTREIAAHLRELYGASVRRDTVSRVTEAVLEDARAWQSRPLEAVYRILYLDALVVKIRDGHAVRNHSGYLGRRGQRRAMCSGSGSRAPRGPSSGWRP